MSNTYTDTVENNLKKLPETVIWQNNVTRLNQTNMNTISSAINVFKQTLKDLGVATIEGFSNVDSNIDELNEWKTKINLHTEPYEIDKSEEYRSSEKIPPVKFVQSALDEYLEYIMDQMPEDVGGSTSDIEVDQIFNPNSENAQSGLAVAEAISQKADKSEIGNINTILSTVVDGSV